MKILYITRKFLPSIGGMQTQSFEFYNALKKKNSVHLVAWGHSQAFLPFFLVAAFLRSVFYLLRYDIDIIQVGDLVLAPLGYVLKRIFRKKTLAMAHGKDVAYSDPVYDNIVITAASRLDGVICVSEFLKAKLGNRGVPRNTLFTNPNGINTELYGSLPDKDRASGLLEAKYGIDLRGKKVLLSVSRMVRKKGIAYFIRNIFPRITRDCPGTVLLLVGGARGGEAKAEQKASIAFLEKSGLRDRVFMLGGISDREGLLEAVYGAADVYIMPNQSMKKDYEGFGIVALEASMHAIPVVAFGVDGIPDAVKDGENGILIGPGDDNSFADTVTELLVDEQKREDIGYRARDFVRKNYSWDVIVSGYEGIAGKVLNSGG